MLYAYQSFIVLIELEVFFFGGFMVQLLVFGLGADYEFYINLAIAPFIVLVPLLSIWGIRNENKLAAGAALSGYAIIPIFSLVKIVYICSGDKYKQHHYFLTLFGNQSQDSPLTSLQLS